MKPVESLFIQMPFPPPLALTAYYNLTITCVTHYTQYTAVETMIYADVDLDFPQIEVKTSTLPCSGNFIIMF